MKKTKCLFKNNKNSDSEKDFSARVLLIVSEIKKGQVMTYKEVAKMAGSTNAYRVVGNILNKNHNPRIPCHRVIRSDGGLGGYNKGPKKKYELLKQEGIFFLTR